MKKYGKLDILKGKIVGLYFDEPSSRTYGSFYVAVQKLGGNVLSINIVIHHQVKKVKVYMIH